MTSYNPEVFTQFIFDTLSSDAAITSLVTGIHSYALQETNPPYLLISMDNVRSLNAAEFAGMEVEFSVKCYSVEAGYSEVFAIMEKVFAVLQNRTGSIAGYQVVNTRLADSEYERLRDGKGIEATLEFRSVIQEN